MNYFQYVDLTNLNPETPRKDLRALAQLACKHGVAGVCVHPTRVAEVARLLKSTSIEVVTVIGFPLGMNTTAVKVYEAKQALAAGATEIDMVINHGLVADKQWAAVQAEIKALKKACGRRVLKVIIETSRYPEAVIIKLTKLCLAAGADFIKTSTGFTNAGASAEHVTLMKTHGRGRLAVKASGGVRDQASFIKLIEAGATRIGTSNINYLLDKNASNSGY